MVTQQHAASQMEYCLAEKSRTYCQRCHVLFLTLDLENLATARKKRRASVL